MKADLARIDALTYEYSQARNRLAAYATQLNEALDLVRKRCQGDIQTAVDECADAYAELEAAIEGSPELFTAPRSTVLYGIMIGWRKTPSRVEYEDAKRVCALIHKHMPDDVPWLIKTSETPIKRALAQLQAKDLKRVGCTLIDETDVVLIKPADGAVDKSVDALLKDAVAEVDE